MGRSGGVQGLAVAKRQVPGREVAPVGVSTTVPGAQRAPTPVATRMCGTRKPRRGPGMPVGVFGQPTVRRAQSPGG